MDGAVKLLKELLTIRSVNGRDDEGAVAEYLCKYFEQSGISAHIQRIDATHANVLAELEGESDDAPIFWNGHLDTVPYGDLDKWETEPWKVAKTDMARVGTILNVALQICANIAVAFEPFLPFTAGRLSRMLRLDNMKWADLGRADIMTAGTQLGEAELLFEKIEDDAVQAQLDRLARIKKENELKNWQPAPVQPEVAFDDFLKLDLRVGTVKECKRVPKADKLLQFLIDDGTPDGRTIVSGIAKYYDPADLVGKQVCFVANFAPRKLKGVESQGMILSAENADGSLVVMGPTGPVAPGAQVK